MASAQSFQRVGNPSIPRNQTQVEPDLTVQAVGISAGLIGVLLSISENN